MEIPSRNMPGNNNFKKIVYLLAVSAVLYAGQAAAGECRPRTFGSSTNGQTNNFNIPYSAELAAKDNTQGNTVTTDADGKEMGWGTGGSGGTIGKSTYYVICDCADTGLFINGSTPASGPIYFRAVVEGTRLQVSNSDFNFYQVNDYLGVGSKVQIDGGEGGFQGYVSAPFTGFSNQRVNLQGCTLMTFNTGANGKVALYFIRPFVGTQTFTATLMALYAGTSPGYAESASTALNIVTINGSISVPQSCNINAGETLTLDVGDLSSSDFVNSKGKDITKNPVTKDFKVKCSNISEGITVSVKLSSGSTGIVADNPNLIATNNKDVGIRFVDPTAANATVIPNQGQFPVNYTITGTPENDSGNVKIGAAAVSTTGNAPNEGAFEGVAQLNVALE